MKLALPILVVVVALLAAGVAAAASASPSHAQSFCSVSRGVAKQIVDSTRVLASEPAKVKVTYEQIAAAEPALKSSAPRSVKVHLLPALSFVNLVIADFKSANWNVSGMTKYVPTLTARGEAVAPHLQALDTYFKTTCKLNV